MSEDGMAYVALSRVHTLDGIALLDLVASKIKASALLVNNSVMITNFIITI